MRIHAIIHAPFEGIGIIKDWAKERNYAISYTHIYNPNFTLPENTEYDLLVIMGGPQSPRETDIYPYLLHEMNFIRTAINDNKNIIGFCLGAQLISECYGNKTQKSPEKEIGIWPIFLTEAGKQDRIFKQFPEQFEVFHWHYDMPNLPHEAVLLAYSKGCPAQAFKIKDNIYGFQFHMEIAKKDADDLVRNCSQDLVISKYTQTPEEMLSKDYDEINRKMIKILDDFLQK